MLSSLSSSSSWDSSFNPLGKKTGTKELVSKSHLTAGLTHACKIHHDFTLIFMIALVDLWISWGEVYHHLLLLFFIRINPLHVCKTMYIVYCIVGSVVANSVATIRIWLTNALSRPAFHWWSWGVLTIVGEPEKPDWGNYFTAITWLPASQ